MNRPPSPPPGVRRRAMRRSVIEGIACAGMVGLGEVWFVADVVRLGGGALPVVLITVLPLAVGSLGALGAMHRLARPHAARRPLVVAAVVAQAAALATLAALTFLDVLDPWGVTALACVYQAAGQAAGTAWSSWFGDLVPGRIRGRFFGRRTAWVHGTTFAGLLVGGLVLHVLEPRAAIANGAGGQGYALLFASAACFRLVSAGLLRSSWEPDRVPAPGPALGYRAWLRHDGSRPARRLLPPAAAFLAAVCVGSPLFAPFQLEVLAFSYPTYMAAQGMVVGVKLLALPGWGRAVDRSSPRRTWPAAALLVAAVPLPWLWADGPGLVFLAQALSGLAWGGYEVSLFALILASTPSSERPRTFATHAVLAGLAQLAGGVAGAALFAVLDGDYRALFALTAAARVGLVPLVGWTSHRLGSDALPAKAVLATRIAGFRPHGGLVLRPVAEPSPPPSSDSGPPEYEVGRRGSGRPG